MSKLILEPGRASKNYWQDLLRFKELFYILSWRDLKVRYKQTVLGVAWSLVRPQGDRVGIIGRNGAGKSTLLKILSRITEQNTRLILNRTQRKILNRTQRKR